MNLNDIVFEKEGAVGVATFNRPHRLNAFRSETTREFLSVLGELESDLQKLNDYDLRKTSLSLRYRARSGESLDALLVEAFGLVREAGRRVLEKIVGHQQLELWILERA